MSQTYPLPCPHCRGTGKVQAETMGERIAAARNSKNLTHRQVAELTEGLVSAGNLQSIEVGRNKEPGFSKMVAIAKVLGVSIDWLVHGDDPLA